MKKFSGHKLRKYPNYADFMGWCNDPQKPPMIGGHHHRRNHKICDCGKIYRVRYRYEKICGKRIKVDRDWWCRDSSRHPDGVPMPF